MREPPRDLAHAAPLSSSDGMPAPADPPAVGPREFRLVAAFWLLFALVSVANHALSLGAWNARDLAKHVARGAKVDFKDD